MIGLLCFVLAVLASPFKSKIRLEAENATLRHQLVVLRRKLKGRAHLTNNDRWFFVQLYRWFPSILLTRRLRAMGIRDKPTAPASPWQNGFAERLIGSIRRECLDHVIVLGEVHLRRNPAILCGLLQRRQNASILGQGCAGLSPGSASRCDQFMRRLGRTSSPLRPCLSFRYTHLFRRAFNARQQQSTEGWLGASRVFFTVSPLPCLRRVGTPA